MFATLDLELILFLIEPTSPLPYRNATLSNAFWRLAPDFLPGGERNILPGEHAAAAPRRGYPIFMRTDSPTMTREQ